ncbi:hypothetical protein, partial [Neisseria sicca]|uniref:hypothetical protein n=1 Tax=Neisseria sicca TaxID=490 RepID=UPI001C99CA59
VKGGISRVDKGVNGGVERMRRRGGRGRLMAREGGGCLRSRWGGGVRRLWGKGFGRGGRVGMEEGGMRIGWVLKEGVAIAEGIWFMGWRRWGRG